MALKDTPGYYEEGTNSYLDKYIGQAMEAASRGSDHCPYGLEWRSLYQQSHVFPKKFCQALRSMIDASALAPVGVTGLPGDEGIGSYRTTVYSNTLRIATWFLAQHQMREIEDLFFERDGKVVRACPSPVFRMMKYGPGGGHGIHHDAPYIESATKRTHYSFVIYLSDASPDEGGRTFFVEKTWDGFADRPSHSLRINDQTSKTEDNLYNVIDTCDPVEGSWALFPHLEPHGVEEFTGQARYIVRGDIFIEEV